MRFIVDAIISNDTGIAQRKGLITVLPFFLASSAYPFHINKK